MNIVNLGTIFLFSAFITLLIMIVNMFIGLSKNIFSYIYESFIVFSLLCIVIDNYINFGIIIPNTYCKLNSLPALIIIGFIVLYIYIKVIPDIIDEMEINPIIAFLFSVLTNILLFIMFLGEVI